MANAASRPPDAPVVGDPYRVTAGEVAAFAEATNDLNPLYLAGKTAPPVYALNPALLPMVEAKKRCFDDFAFHGEHDILFHSPIRPGMELRASAEVIGVRRKSSGTIITVKVDTEEAGGALINEQYFVCFAPEATSLAEWGAAAPAHATPGDIMETRPLARVDYPMDDDQTDRYAAASNDRDAYTTDESVAKSMGFPTRLVHGMCTFAFNARAIVNEVCDGDPERLKRLAVRLSRPVFLFPKQSITTEIWRLGEQSDGRIAFVYRATDCTGEVVMNHGLAEIAP